MSRPLPAILLALLLVGSVALAASPAAVSGLSAVTTSGPSTGGAPPFAQASDPGPPSAVDRSTAQALVPVEGISPNTTRVLQLDSTEASAFESADLAVTNALHAASRNAESTMQVYAAETEIERAEDESARERAIRNATALLEARVDSLEAREADARARFLAEDIPAATYLIVLGEVNERADHLQSLVSTVETTADSYPGLENRLNNLQADLLAHQGPIRDQMGTAVTGGGETARVFVGASGQGAVLATIEGDTYVRGAVRTDARDEAVGGVNLDAAQDRIAELYPWAWVNNGGVSIRSIGKDVFRFELSHDHGSLDSLLDTSSRNVYREVQEKSLSRLPTAAGARTSVNNTTVTVSRAYPGGPLAVDVTNATGAPIQATVTVDKRVVGETGEDGRVWTISPAGTYEVTADTTRESVNVTVTAE